MALPSSGTMTASMILVELGLGATSAFDINNAEVRRLATKPSGGINFADFYGKTYEVVAYITANTNAVIIVANYFNAADRANARLQKRLVINAGVEVGSTTSNHVIQPHDGTNKWSGNLILENRGVISSRGGAANSGVGANVVWGSGLGTNNEKMIVNNYGTMRAGAGGGGRGGNGGGGFYDQARTAQDGPIYSSTYQWKADTYGHLTVAWAGSIAVYVSGGVGYTSYGAGGYTYYRGAFATSYHEGSQDNGGNTNIYYVYRTYTVYDRYYTNGGAGGNGGRGQGYDGGNSVGNGGAGGGTNAGTGGTGGTGGTWGNTGNTGNTGGGGNNGGGAAGATGGLAGLVIDGAANITFSNYGTIQGR